MQTKTTRNSLRVKGQGASKGLTRSPLNIKPHLLPLKTLMIFIPKQLQNGLRF
jgi:hypothetical protein